MAPQRPDAFALLTGALTGTPYPSGISLPGRGGKFDTAGGVQTWRGNTFVSHVTRPSASYDAILELQDQVKQSPFGRFFTFLPAPSFHMTIFQGYSPGREHDASWPQDVPVDNGPDAATQVLQSRVSSLQLPRFRARPTGLFCANSLTMQGAAPADEEALRTARATLRDATGINHDGFDTYVFHITLAYLVQWVSAATAREIIDFSDTLGAAFCDAVPEVALDPCALCAFDDMHHFEPVHVIATEADHATD